MLSLVLVGSGVTTLGAVVVTWPILAGKKDEEKIAGTYYEYSPHLLASLRRQRRFALVGTALALIGVAIQDVGAALP
jgi:hypothetical protein